MMDQLDNLTASVLQGPDTDANGSILHSHLMSGHMTREAIADWIESDDGSKCVKLCLKRLLDGDSGWSLNIIQKLLSCPRFTKVFSSANNDEKLVILMRYMLLEVLQHTLIQPALPEVKVQTIHNDVIRHICDDFQSITAAITKDPAPTKATLDILVMSNELEILCQVSTNPIYSPILTSDQSLITASIDLLTYIHTSSKSPGNIFTSHHKLSDQDKSGSDTGSGIKRDLIRLLGNLCHENRVNQDLVRELAGLPLILDATRIDATNPFITQWSVLAIRNLCDNNTENQTLVASLKTQGLANQVDILNEFGVKAELKGDKVIVKDPSKSDNTDT